MSTPRDLISASLRKIGALASGGSLDAQEAMDGLSEFNRMLDSWSTEGLLINAVTQEAPITLTPGTATYTLGVGGNLTTRPMTIEAAIIRDGTTDYPVDVLTASEYAARNNKGVQASYPDALYDDGGYPQRTLTLYPTPLAAKSLILFTRRPLSSVATLDTVISLPPGYEDAITHNLAIRIAPEYGKSITPELLSVAVDTKSNLKRANHRARLLTVDDALISNGRMFDVSTGGYR